MEVIEAEEDRWTDLHRNTHLGWNFGALAWAAKLMPFSPSESSVCLHHIPQILQLYADILSA